MMINYQHANLIKLKDRTKEKMELNQHFNFVKIGQVLEC